MRLAALCAILLALGVGVYGWVAGLAQTPEPKDPSPSLPALIAEGRELYLEAACYACHGLNAKGSFGPDLTQLRKTDAEIFDFVMSSYRGKVTNREGWKIINYLRSLSEQAPAKYTQADCLFCHEQQQITPHIVKEWRNARDGEPTGTQCTDCHGNDHRVIIVSKGRVPAAICAECHAKRYEESTSGGGHAMADTFAWVQRFVKHSPRELMDLSYAVGREVAHRCTSCHSRHTFAQDEARDPRTCGVCHSGPEHPELDAYANSKHGLIWKREGETGRAPTCVTCHMPDGKHNVSGLVIYGSGVKRVANQPFSPEDQQKRALQIRLCSQCHSERFAKEQLELGDTVYNYTLAAFEEAVAIVQALHADGLLEPASPGSARGGDPGAWNPTVEGGQLYYDLSEVEQRLFRLDYLWRGVAWKSAFHGDRIGSMWHGWYKLQEELSFIRAEARRLRRLHALENALGIQKPSTER